MVAIAFLLTGISFIFGHWGFGLFFGFLWLVFEFIGYLVDDSL